LKATLGERQRRPGFEGKWLKNSGKKCGGWMCEGPRLESHWWVRSTTSKPGRIQVRVLPQPASSQETWRPGNSPYCHILKSFPFPSLAALWAASQTCCFWRQVGQCDARTVSLVASRAKG
jgi:hypothetical protein